MDRGIPFVGRIPRVAPWADLAQPRWGVFSNELFTEHREKFGKNRKVGAKLVRGLTLKKPENRLYNLHNLRKDVFS